MKIEEQKVPTFNVGRMETSVASIQASAKAFEILSSGLYSDAEFAIVREIAANAWDSHKAAGCTDKPFKVQLPNSLDPRFCVRDFGTSMSHEFMMNRVNRYFDSTKADNNDEIGGFGLGIKSVFSYASSFMISCYMDGQRRVYVYQIGESGLPEISLMAETPTDEPNGVEVSIPVRAEDYSKFATATLKTFAFYDVKPEIGGVALELPEFKKLVDDDGWFLCGTHPVFSKASYIEMGGIAYPLEESLTGLHAYYGNNHTLFIKANIGEVDITPNREQIKLTERTRKFVKDKLALIRGRAAAIIQDRIDAMGFDYYWDFAASINTYNVEMLRKLGVERAAIRFNGQKFDDDNFRLVVEPSPVLVDVADPSLGFKPQVLTGGQIAGVYRFATWELHDSGRVKKDVRERVMSFERYRTPTTIVVTEEESTRHISAWMRYKNISKATIVYVKAGQVDAAIATIKERLMDFREVCAATALQYEKPARAAPGDRKYYLYHTNTWNEVVRDEMDLTTLPEDLYYVVTDGRQRGEVYGRTVDFAKDRTFMSIAQKWIPETKFYFLTEAMIKKIQRINPTTTLIEISAELEGMLDDKVREAGQNYVSRSLADIKEPFGRSSGYWRVDSALNAWAHEFNLEDYEQAKKDLTSHNPDANLESMCKLIRGKSIFEMFTDLGVTTKTVTVNSLDELLVKMPYVYALVDSFADEEVINHIATTMGWKRKSQPVTI